MFLPPDATAAQLRVALRHTHERKIAVELLSIEHEPIRDLSRMFLDGQVTGDVKGETSRVLTCTLLDKSRALSFEPDDSSLAPLHRARMIRVVDWRNLPGIGWVAWPVFTGPVWDFERQGAEVTLTCDGKERYMLGQLGSGKTFPAKSKRTDALRWLAAATGETRTAIPDLPYTFPHDHHVAATDQVWPEMKQIADSMNRFVFYDGTGRLHLRGYQARHLHAFDEELLSEPRVHRGGADIINEVIVHGAKPKGHKQRVRGHAQLRASHGQVVVRNGKRIRLLEEIDRPHVKTKREADAIAARVLRRKARMVTDFSAEILPWPGVEEHDVYGLVTTEFGLVHLANTSWALPLSGGEPGGADGPPMTLGSKKRLTKVRVA